MKKLLIAASLLLAITGIGFAQTAKPKPAPAPAKTETIKKDAATAHHHAKKAKGTKAKNKAA